MHTHTQTLDIILVLLFSLCSIISSQGFLVGHGEKAWVELIDEEEGEWADDEGAGLDSSRAEVEIT